MELNPNPTISSDAASRLAALQDRNRNTADRIANTPPNALVASPGQPALPVSFSSPAA